MSNEFDMANDLKSRAPAAERAMALLKCLAQAGSPRGVSELSRELGLGKGTVHALVQALRSTGALEDAPGRKYRLGPLVEELAHSRRAGQNLVDRCRPAMDRLRDATGQTVMLGTVEEGHLKVLAVTEGLGPLRLGAAPGMTLPLHAGAPGKVALAWGAAPKPKTLRRFTDQTITDPKLFARELEEARRRGVALDRGEFMRGLAAAAAPILTDGALQGILFAVCFRDEVGDEGLAALGDAVSHAAAQV